MEINCKFLKIVEKFEILLLEELFFFFEVVYRIICSNLIFDSEK